ncbi:MAG: hypothetical protein ACXADB_10240 [Candidatus Hermodarchaeia archaeon]|jgi:hypothetical protein
MATISFHAGDAGYIANLAGSGLGFFGASFGQSVEVGSYQDTTYITNGTGSIEGAVTENTKWIHPASGIQSDAGEIALLKIPNRLATLNIRFTHGTAVKTQNVKLRIFDRSNINNAASGVTTKVAELIHPQNSQTVTGSGDSTWNTPWGSGVVMDLVSSPGESGQAPNGPQTQDTIHDWYTVISASPDSIGAKTLYGLYVELEYL